MTQQRVSPISVTSVLPAVPVLSLQAALGQSANLTEWRNSSGTVISSITNAGYLAIGRSSTIGTAGVTVQNTTAVTHYHTDNSTATVPSYFFTRGNSTGNGMNIGQVGDGANGVAAINFRNSGNTELFRIGQNGDSIITLQSAASIGLIVKGAASQTADLQQWQTSDGSIKTRINASGALVTASGELSYFSTGSSYAATLNVQTAATNFAGIVIRGRASQTANLQEWQNSAGTIIARVDGGGSISAPYFGSISTAAYMQTDGDTGSFTIFTNTAAKKGLVIRATASQTANLQEWQDSAATVLGRITSAGILAFRYIADTANTGTYLDFTSTSLTAYSRNASSFAFAVRGATSQTADLQQWQNNSGTVLAAINSVGEFRTQSDNNQYLILQNKTTGTTGNYGVYMDSTNSRLQIWTASTARLTFTGDGNAGFFGTSFGGGANVIAIANAGTVPNANPTGGGVLYVEAGALKYRGSSGTVTTIANA